METISPPCPFCRDEGALFANRLAYARPDKFPVNPGHMLVIPRRHVANFFDVSEEEKMAMFALLDEARHHLEREFAPHGYNVGVNVGEAAGQTVMHVHLHLIPRFRGDTPRPRGGVRGVIPERQSY